MLIKCSMALSPLCIFPLWASSSQCFSGIKICVQYIKKNQKSGEKHSVLSWILTLIRQTSGDPDWDKAECSGWTLVINKNPPGLCGLFHEVFSLSLLHVVLLLGIGQSAQWIQWFICLVLSERQLFGWVCGQQGSIVFPPLVATLLRTNTHHLPNTQIRCTRADEWRAWGLRCKW